MEKRRRGLVISKDGFHSGEDLVVVKVVAVDPGEVELVAQAVVEKEFSPRLGPAIRLWSAADEIVVIKPVGITVDGVQVRELAAKTYPTGGIKRVEIEPLQCQPPVFAAEDARDADMG